MHAERYLGGLQRGIWVLLWPNLFYLLTLFHFVICISTVYISCFNILPPVCISTKLPPVSYILLPEARFETWFTVRSTTSPSLKLLSVLIFDIYRIFVFICHDIREEIITIFSLLFGSHSNYNLDSGIRIVYLMCMWFLLLSVVSGSCHHHRNPTSPVPAQLPGTAKSSETFANANGRNHHGRFQIYISPRNVSVEIKTYVR